jgi:hypothetical protein
MSRCGLVCFGMQVHDSTPSTAAPTGYLLCEAAMIEGALVYDARSAPGAVRQTLGLAFAAMCSAYQNE